VINLISKMMIVFCLLLVGIPAYAANSGAAPQVYLDGEHLAFEVEPQIIEGSTLVPLRKIFEELGAKVAWNQELQTVTASKSNTLITYTIGNDYYIIGDKKQKEIGKNVNISVAGRLIDGITLVPLRFVAEALGATVGWDETSRTITISSAIKTKVLVSKILDGSILEIQSGGNDDKLKLIGVDFQGAANIIPVGSYIWIETAEVIRDSQGILQGYVFLEDGTLYNAKLIADGRAKVIEVDTTDRWRGLFSYLEEHARSGKLGIWD
jgi:hypothetical protein